MLNINITNSNSLIGRNALLNITTGSNNCFIGKNAGLCLNTYILYVFEQYYKDITEPDGKHSRSIKIWMDTFTYDCYFQNGKLHREDGPAIESDNFEIWYLNGKLYRKGGPCFKHGNEEVYVFKDKRYYNKITYMQAKLEYVLSKINK